MRFGPGATKEVGMDFANMRAKKILVVTDHNLAKLPVLPTVTDALERSGIKYDIFKDITAEPKDYGVMKAIEFGRKTNYDAYLAVGGGSVMDVAKAINLYAEYPEAELLDFVNAPLGKGKPIDKQLKPLICVSFLVGDYEAEAMLIIYRYPQRQVRAQSAQELVSSIFHPQSQRLESHIET